ncbi:hypothetical protein [Streptomyces sp. NPDC050982]|uniref:hypothetical protein n=1 Tax=Streptomyces sp. NPDC050982 TaxID=3154746 RepID=UPI0033FBA714
MANLVHKRVSTGQQPTARKNLALEETGIEDPVVLKEDPPRPRGQQGGRRPAMATGKTDAVRTAYLEGRSTAALAREHSVSRGAIRSAVADLMLEPHRHRA